MAEKVKGIFSSIRFWQVVCASAILHLASIGYVDQSIADLIAGILGVSVTIGTVDKFGDNFKKK